MDEEVLKLAESLGAILKDYRETKGVKQGDIANKAKISISMLSQIERGVTSPSIETLSRVCFALDINISQLFSHIERRPTVSITPQSDRPLQENHGASYEIISDYSNGAISSEVVKISLEPGSVIHIPSERIARDGAQLGYVLSGSAILTVDGEEYEINAGDGISFSSNLDHSIRNYRPKSFSLARKFVAIWFVSPVRHSIIEFK